MEVHKTGFGRRLGRGETSQRALFEMSRYLATGGEERREQRMLNILMFAQIGHDVREVIEAAYTQAPLAQHIGGLGSFGAPIFEKGYGSTERAHELLQHVGDCVACPRLGDRDGQRMDVAKSRGSRVQMVMASVEGQNGQYLA